MKKFKVKWTLKGTVEVEAEDEHDAEEIVEGYNYEKLSHGLDSWNLDVQYLQCKHDDLKQDGEGWQICKKCGLAGRIGLKPVRD